MAHGSTDLGAFEFPLVRVYCPECHRFAQFRKEGLVERFGTEVAMPDLLHKIQPCDRPNDDRSRCRLIYYDFMSPERRQAALDKGGLPDSWKVGYGGYERAFGSR